MARHSSVPGSHSRSLPVLTECSCPVWMVLRRLFKFVFTLFIHREPYTCWGRAMNETQAWWRWGQGSSHRPALCLPASPPFLTSRWTRSFYSPEPSPFIHPHSLVTLSATWICLLNEFFIVLHLPALPGMCGVNLKRILFENLTSGMAVCRIHRLVISELQVGRIHS